MRLVIDKLYYHYATNCIQKKIFRSIRCSEKQKCAIFGRNDTANLKIAIDKNLEKEIA